MHAASLHPRPDPALTVERVKARTATGFTLQNLGFLSLQRTCYSAGEKFDGNPVAGSKRQL